MRKDMWMVSLSDWRRDETIKVQAADKQGTSSERADRR
jgi:hypothetical protein